MFWFLLILVAVLLFVHWFLSVGFLWLLIIAMATLEGILRRLSRLIVPGRQEYCSCEDGTELGPSYDDSRGYGDPPQRKICGRCHGKMSWIVYPTDRIFDQA